MDYNKVLDALGELGDPGMLRGMAKYGITPINAYGVKIPDLRHLARRIGKDHALAQELWSADWRETRILASMIDDPALVTENQMESWVSQFDYWEICDQCCMNLFEKTPFAYAKATKWSKRPEEFIKRAGFVLMARLAVSDKAADDDRFLPFLRLIAEESDDPRNYVKKGVNWALRQIGKRSLYLNEKCIAAAEAIQAQESASAHWIAKDALRELTSPAVQTRLAGRNQP